MPGAKLDVEGQASSPTLGHVFFFSGSAGPEWGKDKRNRPMQQEDEYRLHMESDPDLFVSQTTRTVSSREDVFFSMADMNMSHSLSSLPPLGEPPTVDLDLSLNSNYSPSLGESTGNTTILWDDYLDVPRQREKQSQ